MPKPRKSPKSPKVRKAVVKLKDYDDMAKENEISKQAAADAKTEAALDEIFGKSEEPAEPKVATEYTPKFSVRVVEWILGKLYKITWVLEGFVWKNK